MTISDYGGNQLNEWRKVSDHVAQNSSVTSQAPFILGQGMLTKGSEVTGALIRGILPEKERQVSELLNHVVQGNAAALQREISALFLAIHWLEFLAFDLARKSRWLRRKVK